jgi:6-phosphogluconolactonase
MQLEIREDFQTAASAAAERIAATVDAAITARGRFTLALSGGSTPWPMLERLSALDLDWPRVHVLQVDERRAPDGDDARNWTHVTRTLLERVPIPGDNLHPMPVLADPPEAAAAAYARTLRSATGGDSALDVVQLGLGDDGHTASLVPGDPVLDVADRDVAWSEEYRGTRRMTLTFPALDRARTVLWLVSGAGKAPMVERLVAGDSTIPGGRVARRNAVLFADSAATANLRPAQ